MGKLLSYSIGVVLFFTLMLTPSIPIAQRSVKADGKTLQEKCDDCMLRTQRQFDHCLAIHGQDHTPCYDQFNEDVVICHRNFCEQ
jgi:hypothetical protein